MGGAWGKAWKEAGKELVRPRSMMNSGGMGGGMGEGGMGGGGLAGGGNGRGKRAWGRGIGKGWWRVRGVAWAEAGKGVLGWVGEVHLI